MPQRSRCATRRGCLDETRLSQEQRRKHQRQPRNDQRPLQRRDVTVVGGDQAPGDEDHGPGDRRWHTGGGRAAETRASLREGVADRHAGAELHDPERRGHLDPASVLDEVASCGHHRERRCDSDNECESDEECRAGALQRGQQQWKQQVVLHDNHDEPQGPFRRELQVSNMRGTSSAPATSWSP